MDLNSPSGSRFLEVTVEGHTHPTGVFNRTSPERMTDRFTPETLAIIIIGDAKRLNNLCRLSFNEHGASDGCFVRINVHEGVTELPLQREIGDLISSICGLAIAAQRAAGEEFPLNLYSRMNGVCDGKDICLIGFEGNPAVNSLLIPFIDDYM